MPRHQDHPASPQYVDHYFEPGHWGLKIVQTSVALLGWVIILVPISCTIFLLVSARLAPRVGRLWPFMQSLVQLKFLAVLLLFCLVMAILFTVTMVLIQNHKRQVLVDRWPTFDPWMLQQRQRLLIHYASQHFGDTAFRHSVKNYHVRPNQVLPVDQLRHLYQAHHLSQSN